MAPLTLAHIRPNGEEETISLLLMVRPQTACRPWTQKEAAPWYSLSLPSYRLQFRTAALLILLNGILFFPRQCRRSPRAAPHSVITCPPLTCSSPLPNLSAQLTTLRNLPFLRKPLMMALVAHDRFLPLNCVTINSSPPSLVLNALPKERRQVRCRGAMEAGKTTPERLVLYLEEQTSHLARTRCVI